MPCRWPSPLAGRAKASSSTATAAAQYTSGDFAALARVNGVVLSVSRKGECWDNAVAESFFATIKRELIDHPPWPTRAGLHQAVFDYIEGWYNTHRLHSSLNYLSPAEYEVVHHNDRRKTA
jgi:putative transposase